MNKTIPLLRFIGYEDKWKIKRLGNISQFINGKAFKRQDMLTKGKYPIIRVGNFYTDHKIYYSNLELNDKYYLNNGDLLYTWSATFGPHIWHGNKVIYHYHIWKVICKSVNKYFLLQLLNIDKNRIQKNGSTMAHITKSGMGDKKVSIPSLSEQRLIGRFFAKLDKIISLQQAKCSLLKKQKRGYLQELFPRKDESVPRIRFNGFTNNWNTYKLGDLVKVSTGHPFKSKDFNKNGKYLVITNSNIQNNSDFVSNLVGHRININNSSVIHRYLLKYNDILITMDGDVGRSAKINNNNMVLAQRVGRLTVNPSLLNFIYQLINTERFRVTLSRLAIGGIIKHISLKNIKNSYVLVPSLFEQRLIGNFFEQVDNNINLQQNKLNYLRKLKKAYLQKMFC